MIAALALIVPLMVVRHAPAPRPLPFLAKVVRPQRVVTAAELPPVEPVALQALSPDEARAYNAAVPFVTGPNPAARPFRFTGTPEDRARALDCLAAAVIYEAGDDAVGERAVAQVVLNRLRHPAFPKTVCGVVFEGAERTTGCQFTFTCDGALTRWTPSEAGWRRAREIADMALSGAVFRPVGYATHYHTDWVVPYWQASLDKIARVQTHLFFRWTGWWGTPPAFNNHLLPGEPALAKMAGLSDLHRLGDAVDEAREVLDAAAALFPSMVATQSAAGPGDAREMELDRFVLTLPGDAPADAWPALAQRTCGDRARCVLTAWRDARQVPRTLPMTQAQMAAMTFSYLRDRADGLERTLWNCAQVPRPIPSQCMRAMTTTPAAAATPRASAPSVAAPDAPLQGVRRAPTATPTPAASATPRP